MGHFVPAVLFTPRESPRFVTETRSYFTPSGSVSTPAPFLEAPLCCNILLMLPLSARVAAPVLHRPRWGYRRCLHAATRHKDLEGMLKPNFACETGTHD
ncbi:unnamed protein product [Merluccius merluccius]